MTSPAPSAARGRLCAVIFDMDGVLIDTEPAWRRVEIALFGSLGLHLSEAECRQTMGMRVQEAVQLWYECHPWPGMSVAQATDQLVDDLITHVREHGEPLPGALEALRLVRGCGLRCAIASSSPLPLIDAVVDRLGIGREVDVVCSAVSEARGKPAPDVYLRAASLLGVATASCLAIEDSVAGILSAQAAGMPCIAVPDPHTADDPRLGAASLLLGSLRELDRERLAWVEAAYFE
ncbi:MAG: hexitol phosphatase HxpB [Candidatus Dormibacteraeota bacterium]|uniref:Hexitol phosphatase HxpB n=1 Tax=Candidatus Amunia macphersoniae TaxID=3127014 RepID=A0A934NAQ6_9BACT|nr:hexitol phosphatase HxpB [Candidatus Dormibacteraeota bacterium]